MKLSPIILKLRLAETRFGNTIGGAADLEEALTETLQEAAYVVQLSEGAAANNISTGLVQDITEIFAVVVAIRNDTTDKDKQGVLAFDSLDDVRSELFAAILNWYMPSTEVGSTERTVDYRGGRLIDVNNAYLWYAFEFGVVTRITDEDGVDNDYDAQANFNQIYAEYIMSPDSENLPVTGTPPLLPINDTTKTDMVQSVD